MQVRRQERCSSVQDRVTRAAHCGVEQRRDEPAVDDRARTPVKQYSIGASHSITTLPSPCATPRYPSVDHTCGGSGGVSTQLRRASATTSCVAVVCCANCSRSAVFLNLPTAVFGISSTNSKRSGSHHLAKCGARNSRSSSSRRRLALLQHDHARAAAPATSRPGSRSPPPRRPPGAPSARSRARPSGSTRRPT